MAANWYCIRTATRQEQKVVDNLRELAKVRRISMEIYLPCETRWNRLARVKTIKQVPMLPGYLFASVDPEHLWRVDKVEGVYQILGWAARHVGKEAEQVDTFVTELRTAQAAGAFDMTKTAPNKRLTLQKGEKVRVSGGQFSGFVGEIIEKRGADRVRVLLTIFGRTGPVIIPAKDLELQDKAPAEAA